MDAPFQIQGLGINRHQGCQVCKFTYRRSGNPPSDGLDGKRQGVHSLKSGAGHERGKSKIQQDAENLRREPGYQRHAGRNSGVDDVGQMLVGALIKRYGITADRMMADYYEAAGEAKDYLFHLLRDSIENQMGSVGSSMI